MLGEHLDDLVVADAVVEVVAKFGGEGLERSPLSGVIGIPNELTDPADVRLCDPGDVVGPLFPVVTIADFLYELGVDGALDVSDLELEVRLVRVWLVLPGRRLVTD